MRAPRSITALTRVDLIASLSVVTILGVIALAAQSRLQSAARVNVCQENLKLIGNAVASFANEHNHRLPGAPNAEGRDPWWWYKDEIKGYLGLSGQPSNNDKVFACPLDRGYSDPEPFSKNPRFNENSYVFNGVTLPGIPNIAGWQLGSIAEPHRTLSLMEWSAHAPLSWHWSRTGNANHPFYSNARSIVAFVNGAVEIVAIYYDGYNAAYTRDPIPGYRYRFSGR